MDVDAWHMAPAIFAPLARESVAVPRGGIIALAGHAITKYRN
jgi:hypothetical protein